MSVEPSRFLDSHPAAQAVLLDPKSARSERFYAADLRYRTLTGDAAATAPPTIFRATGRVDVTYWQRLDTGRYDVGTRGPHRHGYHELLWTRSGDAVHEIDGLGVRAVPGTLLLIRSGQVHRFREARGVSGRREAFPGQRFVSMTTCCGMLAVRTPAT